jgi:epoxyqueuosine reductase
MHPSVSSSSTAFREDRNRQAKRVGATPTIEEEVRAHAFELGFDVCRFAPAEAAPTQGERLRAWLKDGAHGDMGWMLETADRRSAPRARWPEATCLVLLGRN